VHRLGLEASTFEANVEECAACQKPHPALAVRDVEPRRPADDEACESVGESSERGDGGATTEAVADDEVGVARGLKEARYRTRRMLTVGVDEDDGGHFPGLLERRKAGGHGVSFASVGQVEDFHADAERESVELGSLDLRHAVVDEQHLVDVRPDVEEELECGWLGVARHQRGHGAGGAGLRHGRGSLPETVNS
jgi:hypothetical protein